MTDSSEALRQAVLRAQSRHGTPQLSDDTFLGLRQMIAHESGIAFDDRSKFIVERRLLSRLRALRLEDFDEYYRYLLYSPESAAERMAMLEAVAIRETYFFREQQQTLAFRDELLPRLAEECYEQRRLRIWSAGCATGEEPYTIAMLVLASGLFGGWQVEIHATDLSATAIGLARRGLYRDNAMRAIPEDFLQSFFESDGTGNWRLKDYVRRMVTFGTLNLVDTARYTLFSDLDVIVCRNVLIYFSEETRRSVVSSFYDRLREGGYLLLGHAETLVTLNTPFTLFHLQKDLVYRR